MGERKFPAPKVMGQYTAEEVEAARLRIDAAFEFLMSEAADEQFDNDNDEVTA
jgi:hypothetical protein